MKALGIGLTTSVCTAAIRPRQFLPRSLIVFEEDPDTQEAGDHDRRNLGAQESEAANGQETMTKPSVGYVAGLTPPPKGPLSANGPCRANHFPKATAPRSQKSEIIKSYGLFVRPQRRRTAHVALAADSGGAEQRWPLSSHADLSVRRQSPERPV